MNGNKILEHFKPLEDEINEYEIKEDVINFRFILQNTRLSERVQIDCDKRVSSDGFKNMFNVVDKK